LRNQEVYTLHLPLIGNEKALMAMQMKQKSQNIMKNESILQERKGQENMVQTKRGPENIKEKKGQEYMNQEKKVQTMMQEKRRPENMNQERKNGSYLQPEKKRAESMVHANMEQMNPKKEAEKGSKRTKSAYNRGVKKKYLIEFC